MAVDWEAVRGEFPALANWACLNTATFGQLPRRAVEAAMRHFQHRDELACWDFLNWFDDADRIRELLARLIHCQPEDISFLTNAASGLATVLSGLEWHPGDRVMTLADEFPNNLYAPALLKLRDVEYAEVPWKAFFDSVTPNTRFVILSTVNYSTGFRPPLSEVSRFLHERGIPLYVDGTQSIGALQFDVREVRPAVVAVHAYKWLLGPTGSGFLYVHPDFRERIVPSVIGWRSHKGWREVDNLHHGVPEFPKAAEKYEGGMLAFPSLYAMGASVELMLEIGPANIERRITELAEQARLVLRSAGAKLLSDEKPYHDSPVIAARFPCTDPSWLARELKKRRVLVSARHGYLRVSTHFYNNEDDLQQLDRGLRELL